jgi:mannitol/fructose-specific phosphotransferase system IIA component (Ntr-type)
MSEKNWKCNKKNTLTALALNCLSTVQRVPTEDIFEDLDDRYKQRSLNIKF